MRTHNIDVDSESFNAVIDGRKPFGICENNINIQIGDYVVLREYTGNEHRERCPYFGFSDKISFCPAWKELVMNRLSECLEMELSERAQEVLMNIFSEKWVFDLSEKQGEAIKICGKNRRYCFEYNETLYTGRTCTLIVKEVFNFDSYLSEYVAFTFEIVEVER